MLNLERSVVIRQYFGKENESTKKRYIHEASSSSGIVSIGTDSYNVVTRKMPLCMGKIGEEL